MLAEHLEKLIHFAGVVNAGSIRKYSIQKQLSQPAISKCIQNLETAMEANLLIRGRAGIELTQVGSDLMKFAEVVLSQADELDKRIRRNGKIVLNGTLSIGAYQSITVYFFPKLVQFVRRSQEDLKLNILSASSADLIKSLRAGKIDIAVSVEPPTSPDLSNTTLFEDTYSIYQSITANLFANGTPIFTLPTARDKEGHTTMQYIEKANLLQNVATCGDFETVKAMVEAGVGFGFMPDRVALPLLNLRKIERVPSMKRLQRVGKHAVAFTCRKHRNTDHAIDWLRNQLQLMLHSSEVAL